MERDAELGLAKARYEVRKIKYLAALEEYDLGDKRKIRKTETRDKDRKRIIKDEEGDLQEARERMIYDSETNTFDCAKRRTTDLEENSKLTLPKPCEAKEEAELEMVRKIIMDEYTRYKKTLERDEEEKEARKRQKLIGKKIGAAGERDKGRDRTSRNQEWSNLTVRE